MWKEKGDELYQKFEFKNFKRAFTFMTAVAEVAEKQNHHPRWQNEYNQVEIWLTTHSAGGTVTAKDRKLAASIDNIYRASS